MSETKMSTSSPGNITSLLQACADGDLNCLRNLLKDPDISKESLSTVHNNDTKKPRQILNLRNLVEKAARSGHAEMVSYLFSFARENAVEFNALIGRDTLLAALKNPRVDVMAEFVAAQPSCVNTSLGYSGDPLAVAIVGPYIALADDINPETRVPIVRYLLEHGANPNNHACRFLKPGFHLYTAVRRDKPIEMVRLLLEYGAQVGETGATVAAAERGHVDVLELLVVYGADVNEPLTEGIVQYRDMEATKQRARERPIEVARREGQDAIVEWLAKHGAE